MGPLGPRQYGSKSYSLTPELRRSLSRRRNAIGTLHPRSIPLTLFPQMGARSDAQGHGHVATRALLPTDVSVSTRLPQWFIDVAFAAEAGALIYLFGLAATVLTSFLGACRSDGNTRACVLRIDNQAALDALVKGSSSSDLGTVQADLFRSVATRCPVLRRPEYVNAKSNASDPPSRLCDTSMGLSRTQPSGVIPPDFSRISPPTPPLGRSPSRTHSC